VRDAKAGRTVSVCIPARDEGSTVGSVVRAVVQPFLASAGGNGLVDEVLVLDDGSSDDTAEQATDAGARVVRGVDGDGGKGQAMAAALAASHGDLVVFLDADVANTTPAFVTGMLGPLLFFDDIALVKGFYTRPLHGDPTGGGRVTELVARPVLELLFPELSEVRQPLAGCPGPGGPGRADPPQPAPPRTPPPGHRRVACRPLPRHPLSRWRRATASSSPIAGRSPSASTLTAPWSPSPAEVGSSPPSRRCWPAPGRRGPR
jgi:hypothetical protein